MAFINPEHEGVWKHYTKKKKFVVTGRLDFISPLFMCDYT